MEKAIFAAGCFWGVQYYFDQVPGVKNSVVGYIGGNTEDPTYEAVCYEDTGHAEAVLLQYDSEVIDYEALVKHFFRMHDPTQHNRQGPDIGDQYRSAIFYVNERQKEVALKQRDEAQKEHSEPIVTEIAQAAEFYIAEEYHQKFTEKTGKGMCHVPYSPL